MAATALAGRRHVDPERLEGLLCGLLLGRLLRPAVAAAELIALDDRRGGERAVVRRPFHVQHLVTDALAAPSQRLLELGLVIDERRQRVVDPSRERVDDGTFDLLEPVDEEERAERGLEKGGEDVAVPRQAGQLLLGQLAAATLEHPGAEAELAGDDRAALAGD